ncbi:hypothetical protein MMC08_000200 [Hypocenomyce scalaris]|nr:hypothetical protein [Hypocenomyce scalaris]
MTSPQQFTEPPSSSAAGKPSPKPTAFRFKKKRRRDDSSHHSDQDQDQRGKRRQHHRHHHHSKRISPDDPTLYDDTYMPNTASSKYVDPDTAFRESLFDALADDEGAAFWEGVYGQPIHSYPSQHPTGPDGGLEQMTEEEYISFVRAKMWEKSHGYIVEERARREEERKRRGEWKRDEERLGRERAEWGARVEEGLRRGGERKKVSRWRRVWEEYLNGWDTSRNSAESTKDTKPSKKPRSIRDRITWPVESGFYKDVGKDAIETFLRNAPQPGQAGGVVDLMGVLKTERVRWHPDKIQQRFGSLGLDEGTMKAATAVFQVIDRMWSEAREKQGNR